MQSCWFFRSFWFYRFFFSHIYFLQFPFQLSLLWSHHNFLIEIVIEFYGWTSDQKHSWGTWCWGKDKRWCRAKTRLVIKSNVKENSFTRSFFLHSLPLDVRRSYLRSKVFSKSWINLYISNWNQILRALHFNGFRSCHMF